MNSFLVSKVLKPWMLTPIISILFFIGFLLVYNRSKSNSPNKDDAKLKELQQLASEMPIHRIFGKGVTFGSKDINAGVYKCYYSSAGYDEVKVFYLQAMSPIGWKLLEEKDYSRWFRGPQGKRLAFRKQDLILSIEYRGNYDETCNYAISYVWRAE